MRSTPMVGRPAEEYLDVQRAAHFQRMRGLTELKRRKRLFDALLSDHGLFYLEADLRWIDLTRGPMSGASGSTLELSTLGGERFATVPRQRCLWHLSRAMVKLLRYKDRVPAGIVDDAVANLETLLANAWAERDLDLALECLHLLADSIELDGGHAAASHLRNARDEVFTFLANPTAGHLVTGHKGRPDVGTGVLERVMREMNRRSDVGVRGSIPGIRAILMTKLEHKYHHGRWSETRAADSPPKVRFSLEPLPQPAAA